MADKRTALLKRRLTRFLGQTNRARGVNAGLALAVAEVLRRPESRGWRVYLVGGVLRDLLLYPRSAWPRDIDFIVEGASQADLDLEFSDLVQRRTRFGGLHLVKRVVLPLNAYAAIHFDTWCLQDTWGVKVLGAEPSIRAFLATPFLNIDCAAARLQCSGVVELFVDQLLDAVDAETVEINFRPNPFPLVCLVRALILCVQLGYSLGPLLADFVCDYAQTASIEELMLAQISHYGASRVHPDELRHWLSSVVHQRRAGVPRIKLPVSIERQMQLWAEWPPIDPLN